MKDSVFIAFSCGRYAKTHQRVIRFKSLRFHTVYKRLRFHRIFAWTIEKASVWVGTMRHHYYQMRNIVGCDWNLSILGPVARFSKLPELFGPFLRISKTKTFSGIKFYDKCTLSYLEIIVVGQYFRYSGSQF